MKQNLKYQGFTLIELLVVVAIIGLLAGLLFPAISGVLKKSKTATVQTEVKSLESAMNAYYSDYGKFPMDNGTPDKVYGDAGNNNTIIAALRGLDNALNPRRINYLEVASKSLDSSGNMIDAWGGNYRIAVNTDFNTVLAAGVTNLQARNVAVWSEGNPDGGTRIVSW